jgi:8-oxo-dGTP diphosphatase
MWTCCAHGHQHWGHLGAAGLLLVHDTTRGRRYLLQHRSRRVPHGGTWGIPGGALAPAETPYDAAIREATEEAGDLPGLTIVGEHVADCGGWHYVTILAAVAASFRPAAGWETGPAGFRWVTDRQARRLRLHPGLRAAWPELVTIR